MAMGGHKFVGSITCGAAGCALHLQSDAMRCSFQKVRIYADQDDSLEGLGQASQLVVLRGNARLVSTRVPSGMAFCSITF